MTTNQVFWIVMSVCAFVGTVSAYLLGFVWVYALGLVLCFWCGWKAGGAHHGL